MYPTLQIMQRVKCLLVNVRNLDRKLSYQLFNFFLRFKQVIFYVVLCESASTMKDTDSPQCT